MTRKKSEIKAKITKNVPLIWDEYPYATGAVVVVSMALGALLVAIFGG